MKQINLISIAENRNDQSRIGRATRSPKSEHAVALEARLLKLDSPLPLT